MATLDPPPLTSTLVQKDGTPSPTWARWLSLLQALLAGFAITWQTPTLLNSWTNYGAPFYSASYTKDALGWVHLRGLLKGGTAGTICFQLPAGFRPGAQLLFVSLSNNLVGRVDVDTSGNVITSSIDNTAYLSLDGISFYAEA